jgi:hypothetical protein
MPLNRAHYEPISPEYLLNGTQSGQQRRTNMRRTDITTDLAALTTAVATTVAVPLFSGDTVTNITFKSGATAAGTPTHWFFALYSPAGVLLAQTADQTSTAWAANTTKTLALATAQGVLADAVYFASCIVVATTVPTLVGKTLPLSALSTGIFTSDIVLAQTHGSGLTTTAPATIASPTVAAVVPYVAIT